jgi:solute carrier family 25 protein 16
MRESILGSGHASNVHEPSGNMNTAQTFANTKSSRQPAIPIPDFDAPSTLKGDMKEPRPAKVEKRSMEYLLKSGLAGGLAGCAVCYQHILSITPTEILTYA